jgi:N4-gp56 family major capsid protein
MGQTVVGAGDAKAIKRFSVALAKEFSRESYWTNRFVGVGEDAQTPVQLLTDLERDQGDQITYDLVMNLKQQPVEGDTTLKGKEEGLQFYTDNLYIDQMRAGVNCGGRMTRKRTIHQLRKIGLSRQKDWWARIFDELCFIYGSGARGVNDDFILPTTYTGFAGNAISAPDTDHIVYAGAATSKASLASTDKLSLTTVEKIATKVRTMGGGTSGIPAMVPCKMEGEERFVLVMHEYNAYDMRTNTSTGQWLDIQKAAATALGKESPMFKGSEGMYSNIILHKNRAVIRFSDYGAGSNVAASRSLVLGRQGLVCAYGSPGTGMRMNWDEETDDRGNQLVLVSGSIYGLKKATFNSKDFGILAVDAAAAAP